MQPLHVSTESNVMIEIEFDSTVASPDSFNLILLDVLFTEPSGLERCIPAFWAGGNTWRVRYASAVVGVHSFVSRCSDQKNIGLHNRIGTIDIKIYKGENLLLRHGPLQIAADNRHFAHADGMPFFWLGDTWWMGLTKRLTWPDAFQKLTNDRQSKGFNVVQIVAGLYPDMPAFDQRGASESGFPWETDYSAIRPQFFDEADRKIMHLVEQGIVPCILGAWGYHLSWLGTEKMKQHWRYLVARWGALPVVWAAAGEQTMPWYLSPDKINDRKCLKREWSEVIHYLRQVDGFQRLLTTHPQKSARESVNDPKLLDFEMQQTGHRAPTQRHAAKALQGWRAKPAMPVICGESRYEALAITPPVTTRDTRQAFWAHLLNSGCAGHTYGANGVWQVNETNLPFGLSPNGHNWGITPWDRAMHLPGSHQLAKAKAFLLTLPWHHLQAVISQMSWLDKITNALLPTRASASGIAAAATSDMTLSLHYVMNPISLKMDRYPSPVYASWFDPAGGIEIPVAETPFINEGKFIFVPPGRNSDGDTDWVLVLRAE